MQRLFDWTGIEDRKEKALCSACGPTKYSDGSATGYGKWHGRFDRVFLPPGMFSTAKNGNLEHVETGDQNFRKYAVPNAKSEPTAPLLAQVGSTDGLCHTGDK
jgi:hypothetical protein